MPIYDYVCHHCGHRFEVIHGVHADGPRHCPVCHKGPVRKGFAPPTIHFKGSGWAKKDRSTTTRRSASSGPDGATDGASGGESKKSGDTSSTPSQGGGAGGESTGSGGAAGGTAAAD
jgi:putative FmdB family regulatory protein